MPLQYNRMGDMQQVYRLPTSSHYPEMQTVIVLCQASDLL